MERHRSGSSVFCGHSLASVKEELWEQTKLAWPTIVFTLSYSFLLVTNIIFCGRLGKEELAAGSLAVSFCNVTGISIAYGVGSACDTLFSQGYGSQNKKKVGVVVQRALCFSVLTCILIWAMYLNGEAILIAMQVDRKIARDSAPYIHTYMSGIPGLLLFIVMSKYLQNQSIVVSVMLFTVAANLISVPIHYFFLFVLDMHLVGAALALSIVYWILGCSVLLYIRIRNLHKETWGGWSLECLRDWGIFSKLATAGVLVIALEWWAWEIGTFIMGTIGEVQVAAQGSLFNIALTMFMIPYGYCIISSIRVGNSLGAKKPDRAKLVAIVAILSISVITVCLAVILFLAQDAIGRIFTDDREILAVIKKAIPLLALYQVIDGIGQTCIGVLQGCGLQKIGALVNFITYYVISIPIMFALVLAADMYVQGVWISLVVALTFKCLSLIICLARMNWNKQAEQVQSRIGVSKLEMDKEEETQMTLLANRKQCPEMKSDNIKDSKTCSNSQSFPSSDLDVALIMPAAHQMQHQDKVMCDGSKDTIVSGTECKVVYDSKDLESNISEPMDAEYVSMNVIIMRRSLTLVAVLLVFVVGLLIYLFVEIPPLDTEAEECLEGNFTFSFVGNLTFCNTTLLT
ncbi:multidrug and toxin extrusion protein 1-like [Ptychodera flava]|uniref:multidrug and toxin extrusion protein 1-like n=1 Tax=Ptychodera flava TaxID=63121 RepID=UPI003969C941